MMLDVLGMLFTKTVASTWPIGNPLIGADVNEFEVHNVG